MSCHGQLTGTAVRLSPSDVSSSDHISCIGTVEFRLPGELFFYCLHNMVRHEGFAVVLADVPSAQAGFAAQVARKLAAIIVLHDDGVP